MSQAKLREALAGGAPTKEKGPPVADGVISETPDTPEAIEWRTKQSVIDSIASSSTYLDPEDEGTTHKKFPSLVISAHSTIFFFLDRPLLF